MRTADLQRHVRVACAAPAVCACSDDPPVRGVRKPAAPVIAAAVRRAVATPQALTDAHAPVAVSEQALTVEGDSYLVVTRICDGWGPLPGPDAENGHSRERP
jgi:hypothetical protein